ncbi:hypothetical protein ACFUGD_03765 [Streptomyces sp. NPDC057217]|uniref:hypothetical protein n=1 Tax=Streptomyces sp. NPDC057217 TaxID=3346054 RepID=UPI003634BDFB
MITITAQHEQAWTRSSLLTPIQCHHRTHSHARHCHWARAASISPGDLMSWSSVAIYGKGRYEEAVQSMHKALPKVPASIRPLWIAITDTLVAHAPTEVS